MFFGCIKEPRLGKQAVIPMPKSVPLEQFEENWPPKEVPEDSIDISDLSNQADTNETYQENKKIINHISFPTKEYNKLPSVGNSIVSGQIAIKIGNGRRVAGSNARLYLNPYTSYSKQWYKENYMRGNQMDNADDRLYRYLKFTTANADGSYAFYNVPKGKYYLVGTMMCGAECGFDGVKSVRIASEVSVENDSTIVTGLIRTLNN